MTDLWKEILTSAFMGLALPGIVLNAISMVLPPETGTELPFVEETVLAEEESVFIPITMPDGSAVNMQLEEYLVGVVLGEMPPYFDSEALKAQSVVARTYTLKGFTTGSKHGGRICTDPGCCQAYTDPQDFLDAGGSLEDLEKIRNAVLSTSGEILSYEGELIEATYFSCSGGSTEDAVAVWGTDYPYLRAVSSPGEENAAYYSDTKSMTQDVFCAALDISPSGAPESWVGRPTYTPGGGVASIKIGGKEFTGTQLRTLLGLRSTALTISVEGEQILITTRGYGHRVGMSQYGADAMAVAGSSYSQILSHYYPGTILEKWGSNR